MCKVEPPLALHPVVTFEDMSSSAVRVQRF
jgi:hypothetical protein